MLFWLQNFVIVVGVGAYIFATCAIIAQGIQGTWRPENKYWRTCLVVGPLMAAAFFATLITFNL